MSISEQFIQLLEVLQAVSAVQLLATFAALSKLANEMVNVYRVNITYRRIAKLVQKTTVKQFLIGVNCLLCQFANDRKIFDIIDVVK